MDTIQKIKQDINERSIKHQIKPISFSGSCRIEYDYCYYKSKSEIFKDYYFVVSKYIEYKGSSIADYGREIYIYDKDGNFVDNPELKNNCKGDFYNTLIDC